MKGFDLKRYVEEKRALINQALEQYLPETQDPYEEEIIKAMRYSLFAGGKRLRPILCIAGAEAVGGTAEQVIPLACGLELIHTYSLIHDDLPAMDDDDLRRGLPTNHTVFGEALAILAGDGLLTEAFRIMTLPEAWPGAEALRVLKAVSLVAEAAGYKGMVGGQAMDIRCQGKSTDLATINYIHSHKTGALIRVSVVSGALVAGGSERALDALDSYGSALGMAFQIWDDVLDIEGDTEEMGKTQGKDIELGKATYPSVIGMEEAKKEAHRLVATAIESLKIFGKEADPLRAIANYVTGRRT